MENIFEGVRFGDKFRTRDGKPAVYLSTEHYGSENDKDNPPFVIVFCAVEYHFKYEDGSEKYTHYVEKYDEKGKWNKWDPEDNGLDIVGKWEEPISEEELDRLADSELDDAFLEEGQEGQRYAAEYGFKLGYRKRKEEE